MECLITFDIQLKTNLEIPFVLFCLHRRARHTLGWKILSPLPHLKSTVIIDNKLLFKTSSPKKDVFKSGPNFKTFVLTL